MQRCCLCDGGNALPVGGLPMAVSTTLRTYSADVSLESRVCTPCLKDIGKNRSFGWSNKDRDCASSNYNCTRQTKKTRRVKSLRPIPEYSLDAREVLGIPHYAPSQCICRTCYASLQNASRRSKRAAVSTPVKKKTKMESPSTPDRMSTEELHESLVMRIISLTSEEDVHPCLSRWERVAIEKKKPADEDWMVRYTTIIIFLITSHRRSLQSVKPCRTCCSIWMTHLTLITSLVMGRITSRRNLCWGGWQQQTGILPRIAFQLGMAKAHGIPRVIN